MITRTFCVFGFLFIFLAVPLFAQHVSWSIGDNSSDKKGKSVRKDYTHSIDSLRDILKTTSDSLPKRKIQSALHSELMSEAKYNYDSAHYEESALLYEEAFDI